MSVSYAAKDDLLQISSSSSPSTNSAPITVKKDTSADKLVKELQSILKTLPVEDPLGSEDIYGLDTSIMWGSDDFTWVNGGAEGCGGTSKVKATDEEKVKFKRALEIADKLVAIGIPS